MEKTRDEQDRIIKNLLLNFAEILQNLIMTVTYFPESMLDTLRSTSLPLFMANVYCIMEGPAKHIWLKESNSKDSLENLRRSLKRLSLEVCLTILDIAIVRHVGVHHVG